MDNLWPIQENFPYKYIYNIFFYIYASEIYESLIIEVCIGEERNAAYYDTFLNILLTSHFMFNYHKKTPSISADGIWFEFLIQMHNDIKNSMPYKMLHWLNRTLPCPYIALCFYMYFEIQ